MKRVKLAAGAFVAGLVMTGCSIVLPVTATSNAVGSKVGKAEAKIFLSVLYFNQDASIQKAAKNGGITKISTVDVKRTSILGLIDTYETIVTGE